MSSWRRLALSAEVRWLSAALLCALVVPFAAAAYLDYRIDRHLEPALSGALGVPVSVGRVEASLTGSLRLEEVGVAPVLEARALEASVGLSSLLAGEIRADEIRIESPRLHLTLGPLGRVQLERMLRRAARSLREAQGRALHGSTGAQRRLRRIVARGGDLVIDLGERGRLRVSGVELHPQRGGVRVVSGPISADLRFGPWKLGGRFERAGADITLPDLDFPRLLALGGELALDAPGAPTTAAKDAVLARGVGRGGELELSARLSRQSARIHARLRPGPEDVHVRVRGQAVPLAALAPLVPPAVDLTRATASGHAELRLAGPRNFSIALDAELSGAAVEHRRLASEPVPLSGHVEGRARVLAGEQSFHLDLDRLHYREGDLALFARGRADLSRAGSVPERASLRVEMARTSCIGALLALPEPLRDRLAGADARGTLAAAATLTLDRAHPEAIELDLSVDAGDCKVLLEPPAADPRRLLEPFAHRYPDGSTGRVGRGLGGYVSLRELPRHVVGAFTSAEDGRFFSHSGFDLEQIERSLATNVAEGRLMRGGSTISQQLVKNVFLDPERNLARKLQEAILTWRLETHLSKRQILERYLNIIELGEGVFGVDEGARHWFGKPAPRLSPREAAFLAAITSAPGSSSRRIRKSGAVPPELQARVDLILRNMRRSGALGSRAFDRARRAELRLRREVLAAASRSTKAP